MPDKNSFIVIINPYSGKNRKFEYFKEVLELLDKTGIEHKARYTSEPLHASKIAYEAVDEGFRKIIVIGGDGTFNEVVQGVCRSTTELRTLQFVFVPAGTGNDWHRTMFPNGFDLKILKGIIDDQNYVLQDLGVVTYLQKPIIQKNYFVNVVGTGYDVFVAQQYLRNSKKAGPTSYLFATLRGLLSYKNIPLHISIGEKTIEARCFIAVAGIGQFFAGGMKILPGSQPNNGLLEITVIKNLSKIALLRALPQIYSGGFIRHPDVESMRCKTLEISSSMKNIFIQVDGEIRGELPVKIEIIPRSLKVFAPDMERI